MPFIPARRVEINDQVVLDLARRGDLGVLEPDVDRVGLGIVFELPELVLRQEGVLAAF